MAHHDLLTVKQMYEADQHAVDQGVPSLDLMEHAGQACVDEILGRVEPCPALVLCGPGNNGGDGFVIARLLVDAGWPVTLGLLGGREALAGDAAAMAAKWQEDCVSLSPNLITDDVGLIVDCLFGAGLARPVEGGLATLVEAVNASAANIVAVDVPSGIDGDTGAVRGTAVEADFTVTFFRAKPGHLLYPGRAHCGDVRVRDIGIPDSAVRTVGAKGAHNAPGLWLHQFPLPDAEGHKYTRGHLLVRSGGMTKTGAARMAAMAGLRAGAGLVTVAGPPSAQMVLANHLTAIMIDCERDADGSDGSDGNEGGDGAGGFAPLLADTRRNAVVVGPANGVNDRTRAATLAACAAPAALVLDADALTCFQDDPETLFTALKARTSPAILTPHEGEFARLFIEGETRFERAMAAAVQAGAVVVLKGPDTIIASPDWRFAINDNAGPELGTAGSGDVLAGLIGGLLAQGMAPYEAACAGVWLHGEAGRVWGLGLIAEDLPDLIATVIESLVYGGEAGFNHRAISAEMSDSGPIG